MLSTPDLSALLNLGRYAIVAYVAGATILTTACLALHAVTRLDRHMLSRAQRAPRLHRPLFVSIPSLQSDPDPMGA